MLGLAVLDRLVIVFPFDLGERFTTWETPLRALLWLAALGVAIAARQRRRDARSAGAQR